MSIVPCPQCAKPMEQDDGFCGSCGAITDPDLTIDEGSSGPHSTAPESLPPSVGSASGPPTGKLTALGTLDMGADFDERTDVSTPPFEDAPPPPVMVTEKPADNFHAFLEEQTGAFVRDGAGLFEEDTGSHRADRQAMVQPQVVLRCKAGVDRASLSPFEQHVLSFLDGRRPLARLRKKAGLSFSDLKVAIGMLADRGIIEVVGNFVPDLRGLLEEDDVADSGPHGVIPPPPAPAAAPKAPSPKPAARPAPMPLPGQSSAPPRTATPPPRAAPPRPAAVVPRAPPPVVVAPAGAASARVQANQLLERALVELRAGKRPAALALMHMAAELLPGDPKIEAALKSVLLRK